MSDLILELHDADRTGDYSKILDKCITMANIGVNFVSVLESECLLKDRVSLGSSAGDVLEQLRLLDTNDVLDIPPPIPDIRTPLSQGDVGLGDGFGNFGDSYHLDMYRLQKRVVDPVYLLSELLTCEGWDTSCGYGIRKLVGMIPDDHPCKQTFTKAVELADETHLAFAMRKQQAAQKK
jgi:hypothetical protein